MSFERFIARRYLFSGQHKALLSLITFISIGGVAVGVFALIVVLAVMEGFTTNLLQKFIGAYAHIEVRSYNPALPYVDVEDTLEKVRSTPGVKAASPVILGQALALVPSPEGEQPRQSGLFIMGIDPEHEKGVTIFLDKVTGSDSPGTTDILLSKVIARDSLYVGVGQRIRLLSPTSAETPDGRAYVQKNVNVSGLFETGFPEADQMFALMSLDAARNLFLIPEGKASSIHLSVKDPAAIESVRKALMEKFGHGFQVITWQDRNPVLFNALQVEKWAMFVILLLIVLVAAFNIIGTLVMVVTEKTREIGILKSMGATEGGIMRIFVVQGLIIGGLGTALGTILGLVLCYLLEHYIRLPFDTTAYLSDRIPVLMNTYTNVLIVASSLLICLIASVYPARAASRLDPVEALRHE